MSTNAPPRVITRLNVGGPAIQASELSTRRLAEGVTVDQLVGEVEELYPYDLNSQKPLSERVRP